MTSLHAAPDTFTLSGDHDSRIAELLRLVQHQARIAQTDAAPRMQDALTELEDAISDQIAALDKPPKTTRPTPKRPARPHASARPGAR